MKIWKKKINIHNLVHIDDMYQTDLKIIKIMSNKFLKK